MSFISMGGTWIVNEISDTRYLECGGYIAVLRSELSTENDFFSWGGESNSLALSRFFGVFPWPCSPHGDPTRKLIRVPYIMHWSLVHALHRLPAYTNMRMNEYTTRVNRGLFIPAPSLVYLNLVYK